MNIFKIKNIYFTLLVEIKTIYKMRGSTVIHKNKIKINVIWTKLLYNCLPGIFVIL